MHVFNICACALTLAGTIHSAIALSPDIRADTNRDGHVDISGDTDVLGKAFWSNARGAIFLPNIGDANGRCPVKDLIDNPLSDEEIAKCNDASGHVLFTPEYLAPIKTVPMPELSDTAYANIYATPIAAYDRVRLFFNDSPDSNGSAWRLVDKEFSFSAKQLQEGLILGLDSRELVMDSNVWDGVVTVRFDLIDNSSTASDAVALRLAPVLTHNHLQKVDTLISVAANNTTPVQERFITQLDEVRRAADIQRPLFLFNQSDDIWAQDFIEPAFASMPGLNGSISIRIILRSAQSTRTAGRQVFEQLRGKGIGGFQPALGFGHREINSFGNLETIPPYVSKTGVHYKAGRIIMGKHFDELPAQSMLNFLNGQRLQTPLILEAGWLMIGHVDEFVQFVPYPNMLGWTISIADTRSALKIFKDAQSNGYGDLQASSFDSSNIIDASNGFLDFSNPNTTIDQLLDDQDFIDANTYAQRQIDFNLQILLAEIDIDEHDVVRVPVLFKNSNFGEEVEGVPVAGDSDGLPSHQSKLLPGEKQLASYAPAAINGIVLGEHYLSPKPWGPIVDGKDIIAEGVKKAYGRAGMSIDFIDDYLSHHIFGGEIHCGSNTLRQMDLQWWD
jgi:protein-arginine deiminase